MTRDTWESCERYERIISISSEGRSAIHRFFPGLLIIKEQGKGITLEEAMLLKWAMNLGMSKMGDSEIQKSRK
jgi:hypothetical protein